MAKRTNRQPKRGYKYFRVLVTYSDGETSANRVFKDRAKAERFVARQKKSPVVKKTVIESVVRQQYGGRPKVRTKKLTKDIESQ
jgi:hypothetical protein